MMCGYILSPGQGRVYSALIAVVVFFMASAFPWGSWPSDVSGPSGSSRAGGDDVPHRRFKRGPQRGAVAVGVGDVAQRRHPLAPDRKGVADRSLHRLPDAGGRCPGGCSFEGVGGVSEIEQRVSQVRVSEPVPQPMPAGPGRVPLRPCSGRHGPTPVHASPIRPHWSASTVLRRAI